VGVVAPGDPVLGSAGRRKLRRVMRHAGGACVGNAQDARQLHAVLRTAVASVRGVAFALSDSSARIIASGRLDEEGPPAVFSVARLWAH